MDLVLSIQQRLHELRMARSQSYSNYEGSPPDVANNVIADVMNLMETLFVVINLPGDGFVSLTPRSQDVGSEEAPPSGL